MSEQKQSDATPTSHEEILQIEIAEGLTQLNRPFVGLALSGMSAGLDIGFGPFLMAVVLTISAGVVSEPVTMILVANAYSVGFIFVVLGRSELFTEQTTLAVVPVLHGRATLRELVRLWGTVYTTNLLGGAAFSAIAVYVGPQLGTVELEAFGELAHTLVAYSPGATLVAGVLAGWLMGLMSWLVAAGENTISQVVFVWIIATVIGLGHLPHSIAGSVEVMVGMFARQGITLLDFGGFLLWATLGNVVGGSIFVGLLKYGHGIRPGAEADETNVDVSGEGSVESD